MLLFRMILIYCAFFFLSGCAEWSQLTAEVRHKLLGQPTRPHYAERRMLHVAPEQVITQPAFITAEQYSNLERARYTQDMDGYLTWLRLSHGQGYYDLPMGPPPAPVPPGGYKNIKLKAFNQIDIYGPFHVNIRPTKGPRMISIKGSRRMLNHLLAMVKNGRLVLDLVADKIAPSMVNVDIAVNEIDYLSYMGNGDLKMRYVRAPSLTMYLATTGEVQVEGSRIGLRQLEMNGAGSIVLSGISSKYLDIDSKGRDRLSISGVAGLRVLKYSGASRMALHWIDSPYLEVHGTGYGYARLAGSVKVLEAHTDRRAVLDAKYLRAGRAFVKTHDHSEVHMQSIRARSTLAEDRSHIYVYNQSKFSNDYMGDNGSVLDYMTFARM